MLKSYLFIYDSQDSHDSHDYIPSLQIIPIFENEKILNFPALLQISEQKKKIDTILTGPGYKIMASDTPFPRGSDKRPLKRQTFRNSVIFDKVLGENVLLMEQKKTNSLQILKVKFSTWDEIVNTLICQGEWLLAIHFMI